MHYSIEELEQILGDISEKEIKYFKIDNVKNDIRKAVRKQIESLGYAYYTYYDDFIDYVEEIILKDIEREYTYWSLFKHQFRDYIHIKYITRDTFKTSYYILRERIETEETYSENINSIKAIANDIYFFKDNEITFDILKEYFDIEFLDKSTKSKEGDNNEKYFLEKYFNPIKRYKNPAILLYKKYSYTGGLGGYNCHSLDYEVLILS